MHGAVLPDDPSGKQKTPSLPRWTPADRGGRLLRGHPLGRLAGLPGLTGGTGLTGGAGLSRLHGRLLHGLAPRRAPRGAGRGGPRVGAVRARRPESCGPCFRTSRRAASRVSTRSALDRVASPFERRARAPRRGASAASEQTPQRDPTRRTPPPPTPADSSQESTQPIAPAKRCEALQVTCRWRQARPRNALVISVTKFPARATHPPAPQEPPPAAPTRRRRPKVNGAPGNFGRFRRLGAPPPARAPPAAPPDRLGPDPPRAGAPPTLCRVIPCT